MARNRLPHESLSEEEAHRRHPDCEYFTIFNIYDGNESRRGIFAWRTFAAVSQEEPLAVYWLNDS